MNSERTKPIKDSVLIENLAKVKIELDTGSLVSAVPIARFWCIFTRHKMFLVELQRTTYSGLTVLLMSMTLMRTKINCKILLKKDNFL